MAAIPASRIQDLTGRRRWVTAKVAVKRWDPGSEPVFGGLDQFELEFRGSATASGFSAKGSIVERPEATLAVEGRLLAPAV